MPEQTNVVDITSLLTRVERESKIAVAADAPRASYGHATVAAGTRPVGSAVEDVLVIIDGSSRVAFPQSAVLTAILGGVIPSAVLDAVIAARDSRAA